MSKFELDHLLEQAVADALGVELTVKQQRRRTAAKVKSNADRELQPA